MADWPRVEMVFTGGTIATLRDERTGATVPHVRGDALRRREAIASGVPVVLVSARGAGRVAPAFGFPRGARTGQASGVIECGTLSGPAAEVALALGLGAGLRGEALRALFAI